MWYDGNANTEVSSKAYMLACLHFFCVSIDSSPNIVPGSSQRLGLAVIRLVASNVFNSGLDSGLPSVAFSLSFSTCLISFYIMFAQYHQPYSYIQLFSYSHIK